MKGGVGSALRSCWIKAQKRRRAERVRAQRRVRLQASCCPDSRGFPGPEQRPGHSPRLEVKRTGSLLMLPEQGQPATGGQWSGGCGSDATTSPFGDNKKRPCAARALLLLLSLTPPPPPPLFSAPLLARTGAAFADNRTKGSSSLGRSNRLEEGQNLSRMDEFRSELPSGFQGAMETVCLESRVC